MFVSLLNPLCQEERRVRREGHGNRELRTLEKKEEAGGGAFCTPSLIRVKALK